MLGAGVEGATVDFDASGGISTLEASVSAVESLFRLRGGAVLAAAFVAEAAVVSGALLLLVLLESSENRPWARATASDIESAPCTTTSVVVVGLESFLTLF